MSVDSLTEAIRDGTFGFCPPAWSDDVHQDLVAVGGSQSDAVAVAVRKRSLRFAEALDWSSGSLAIENAFALSRRRLHLFREQSVTWTKFHETQFTKGFVRFLNAPDAPDPCTRIERVCALLNALGVAASSDGISQVEVEAEKTTSEKKRIDILIKWKDFSEKPCAAVIEAKLVDHIASDQVSPYRDHLRKERIANKRQRLVVVSPKRSDPVKRFLKDNPRWHWKSWHDLLVAYERSLPDKHDDKEYVSFRRAVWDQTG